MAPRSVAVEADVRSRGWLRTALIATTVIACCGVLLAGGVAFSMGQYTPNWAEGLLAAGDAETSPADSTVNHRDDSTPADAVEADSAQAVAETRDEAVAPLRIKPAAPEAAGDAPAAKPIDAPGGPIEGASEIVGETELAAADDGDGKNPPDAAAPLDNVGLTADEIDLLTSLNAVANKAKEASEGGPADAKDKDNSRPELDDSTSLHKTVGRMLLVMAGVSEASAISLAPPVCETAECATGLCGGLAAEAGDRSRRLGTALNWAESIDEASAEAHRSGKLVFVIHVSGNFEIEEFT